jgi:DNA polymerase III subunit delta
MSKHIPVHLLLGPETGEKDAFLEELKQELAKRHKGEAETHRFYPFETDPNQVVALLRNGALFSAHRLVIYDQVEQLKRKDEVERLVAYIQRPADDATLVLLSESIQIDKRLDRAIPKQAKRIFWEMFDNQKAGWVKRFFQQRDMRIEDDAAQMLLELVENNTRDLGRECGNLALFLGPGHTVTEEDVESFMYHSKEENVFTLFDRMGSGDFEGSLEVLQKILRSGESGGVQLLAGLVWQFRRLRVFQRLRREQYSVQEACGKAGIRGKRNQRTYTAAASHYMLPDLERIIVLMARYDALLRTVRAEVEPLLLQMFLYYCVVRKGELPDQADDPVGPSVSAMEL